MIFQLSFEISSFSLFLLKLIARASYDSAPLSRHFTGNQNCRYRNRILSYSFIFKKNLRNSIPVHIDSKIMLDRPIFQKNVVDERALKM